MDTSDSVSAEIQASAEQRLADLDEVLSIIIHELRNPLTVMQGFATTLVHAAEDMDPAAVLRAAKAVERGARRMDALLGTLRDAKSFDRGELDLDLSEVLVSNLIREVVLDIQTISDRHRLSLSVQDDALLRVDVIRIQQILGNLLSNAIKFSPSDTKIEVSVARDGDAVCICVEDEGVGIDPARADELFKKFSRLGSNVTGTGLGLYLSRRIAQAHGGELALGQADGPGGCRFILTLPVHGRRAEHSLPRNRQHRPR